MTAKMINVGDIVTVNGYRGVIARRRINLQDEWEYLITFDEPMLIGGNSWYPSEAITVCNSIPSTRTTCPICGSKWSVTKSPVYGNEWYDCKKCQKTREQILGEKTV